MLTAVGEIIRRTSTLDARIDGAGSRRERKQDAEG
jgi:hypothetical protein